jgi:hypothetical protein
MSQYSDPADDSDTAPDDLCEDLHDAVVSAVRENPARIKSSFLFGSANRTSVQLSTLHPDPVQIFRLWHIYLENVNSLLGLTHTPSLQGHIIDAASNVANIEPNMEALLFGIYCMAIISLDSVECVAMFGRPRDDLLRGFQFGCQEALLSADFLRTRDRHCLIALIFYLVRPLLQAARLLVAYISQMSIRSMADPQSLASLLGIANRIAYRIGLHSESKYASCGILEAQMRRRLWWVLVLFDARVGELAEFQPSSLSPVWDCHVPLNVNDSDLRSDMKSPPASRDMPTEAIFAVVRATIGNFVRHSAFHLDFTNPALNAIASMSQNSNDHTVAVLARMIEERYLKQCDPENPFHFMTIWTARTFFAKYQLMEDYWKYLNAAEPPTDEQRDTINLHACQSLENDTKIFQSPLCKRYIWILQVYFPFPAYIQLFQDMKKRPFSTYAERAWKAIGENYTSRHIDWAKNNNHMFGVFSKLVLHTWEVRIHATKERGLAPEAIPPIVAIVKQKTDLPSQTQVRRNSGPAIGFGAHGQAIVRGNAGDAAANKPFEMAGVNGNGRSNAADLDAMSSWNTSEDVNILNFDTLNMDWWFKDILGANQNW